MTPPLDWISAVKTILGLQDNGDPSRVKTPNWIEFELAFTEESGQQPWAHWMPQGPGKGNWNEITLYRWRDQSTPGFGGAVSKSIFQLVRAKVPFYSGAQGGDGSDSPSKQADLLINANDKIINDIDNNQFLDPKMFKEVANRFWNVWFYLAATG